MDKDEILNSLKKAVLDYDKETAAKLAKQALQMGINPVEALEKGLAPGIKEIGDKFERMEVFLPHVVMAVEAMQAASDLLLASMSKEDVEKASLGTVVIGTVKGDIHDIGKTLVSTMLAAAGFKVIDLGVDVPATDFIKRGKETGADIVALSALMTTTILEQRDVIDLKRKDPSAKFKIIVGGGAVGMKWAKEIRADGYGDSMLQAVTVAKNLAGAR